MYRSSLQIYLFFSSLLCGPYTLNNGLDFTWSICYLFGSAHGPVMLVVTGLLQNEK